MFAPETKRLRVVTNMWKTDEFLSVSCQQYTKKQINCSKQ